MKQLIILTVFFSFFLISCDNNTNPQQECGPFSDPASELELLYPSANDQFTAGEIINIQWKVNSRKISKVNLSVSINDGFTFDDILTTMLVPDDHEIECMNVNWEIGKLNDNSQIIVKDTTLLLMINDYDGETFETVAIKIKK